MILICKRGLHRREKFRWFMSFIHMLAENVTRFALYAIMLDRMAAAWESNINNGIAALKLRSVIQYGMRAARASYLLANTTLRVLNHDNDCILGPH